MKTQPVSSVADQSFGSALPFAPPKKLSAINVA